MGAFLVYGCYFRASKTVSRRNRDKDLFKGLRPTKCYLQVLVMGKFFRRFKIILTQKGYEEKEF